MPVFEFAGYDSKGALKSGVIDADSPKGARIKLRQQGVMVTNISSDSAKREILLNPLKSLFQRVSDKEIATFTRQLATLQAGGLTLVESLDALIEQSEGRRLGKVVTDIREKVLQGASLADSMREHHRLFDPLYVNLVRAGEATGALDETLSRLAVFHENRLKLKSKVTAAMVYPAVMTVVGAGALLYLLTSVTPKVKVMFEDMGQALPMPTVILLAVSDFLINWWALLIVSLAGLILFIDKYRRTQSGKEKIDRLSLKIPLFGNLIRYAAVSRFARALSVLLTGGVALIESLKVTAEVVDNATLSNAIGKAIINITEGETIAGPLKNSGLFPPLVTQMIMAGEKSGSLPTMLEKVADAYEFEVETAVTALTSLVEPILILVMGSVVGFIVLAILLPIFEISQMTG